jgi:hypothetical protein
MATTHDGAAYLRAITPVSIDIDMLEKENRTIAPVILFGKFDLNSKFLIRIKIYDKEHYENDAVKILELKPTYVEKSRIFLEISVEALIPGVAKIDLSHDSGDTYSSAAHNFSITQTKSVEILRLSPLAWSVKGGTKVRMVAKPLFRLRTPIKYIRIRISYAATNNNSKNNHNNDLQKFESVIIIPEKIYGSNLEFKSPILPLQIIDSIISVEISLNGGNSFSNHFNLAVVYDGLPIEVEHINPTIGKVAGGTKINITLPTKKQYLINRLCIHCCRMTIVILLQNLYFL